MDGLSRLFDARELAQRIAGRAATLMLMAAVAACGGGGGDSEPSFGGPLPGPSNGGSPTWGGSNGGGSGGTGNWTPGVYPPSSNFYARCAAPRTDTHPLTGEPWPDVQGTVTDENNWLRSMTNELYLWYGEVQDRNPSLYTSPLEYFDLLKTTALTPSGRPKDQFHFTYDTDEWIAFSGSGETVSYGVQWVQLPEDSLRVVVAFREPNAPNATIAAALNRGVEVMSVDGVSLASVTTDAALAIVNAGLFPSAAGETHTFVVRDLNGTQRTVQLTSSQVTSDPVPVVNVMQTAAGRVGYLLFNDHIATSEGALYDAIDDLRTQAVQELVIDLRYNGGGFLDIASELAYMVAGDTATAGQTFELLQFNDKHPTTDPVTGEALAPTPFHDTSQGFDPSLAEGTALPTLNLNRVYVLTGPDTCSASESLMNGLRGVNVEVIQIGSTTCGKPYGFYGLDNCGTTYFTIQFRGVNAKNFGDYADGFSPSASPNQQAALPGCSVADDFSQALGNPAENRLEAAIQHMATGACIAFATSGKQALAGVDGVARKPAWRTNRLLRP